MSPYFTYAVLGTLSLGVLWIVFLYLRNRYQANQRKDILQDTIQRVIDHDLYSGTNEPPFRTFLPKDFAISSMTPREQNLLEDMYNKMAEHEVQKIRQFILYSSAVYHAHPKPLPDMDVQTACKDEQSVLEE